MVIPLRSEIGQNNDFSRSWSTVQLKDIIVGTMTYGVNAPAVSYSKQLPKYIRITDISDEGKFKPSPLVSVNCENTSTYSLKEGDVLFARTGNTTGKSYIYVNSDGALVFAGFLIKATINKNIANPRFVFYYTQTEAYWKWVKENSMRSGQPGINSNQYSNLPLPYPPLLEQNAIASVLTNLDNLIESLEKLIAKKKLIKEGAMQDLLTGKKRLVGFDGDWYFKEIAELTKEITVGFVGSMSHLFTKSGIPVLRGINIHQNKLCMDDLKYISSKTHAEWKKSALVPNDVVIVRVGYPGTACVIPKDIGEINAASLVIVRPDSELLDSYYLSYYLNSPLGRKQTEQLLVGGAQQVYNISTASKFLIYLPEINEQVAISTIFRNMDAEIETLEAKLAKYRQIKTGAMQQLLTGKIRLPQNESAEAV